MFDVIQCLILKWKQCLLLIPVGQAAMCTWNSLSAHGYIFKHEKMSTPTQLSAPPTKSGNCTENALMTSPECCYFKLFQRENLKPFTEGREERKGRPLAVTPPPAGQALRPLRPSVKFLTVP
jgi:hypothetical protein